MTRSLIPREILWRHISKTRRAIRLKFCIRNAFMAIMTYTKFHFNWLMLTLIFGIWASEPRACRTTEKAGPDRDSRFPSSRRHFWYVQTSWFGPVGGWFGMIGSLYGAPGIEWIAESLNPQGAYADGIVPQLKFFVWPNKRIFHENWYPTRTISMNFATSVC